MRDPVAEQFAQNLKRVRKQAGISQEELGLIADLHRTEISLLETGARTPKISTLLKLCAGLQVKPSAMLQGIEWKPGDVTPGSFSVKESGASSL